MDGSDDEEEPAPSTPKSKLLWQAIPEHAKGWWMKPEASSTPGAGRGLPEPSQVAPSRKPVLALRTTSSSRPTTADGPAVSLQTSSSAPTAVSLAPMGSSSKQKAKIRKPILKPGPKATPSSQLRPTLSEGVPDLDLPGPEQAWNALEAAATVQNQWQTDANRHKDDHLADPEAHQGVLLAEPRPGKATLKVVYFFSGVKRRAPIAQHLARMCKSAGVGLRVYEIDVLVGGSDHDLWDKQSQEAWLARVEQGEFVFIILSPPCGSWSRSNWANDDGPQPCRDRKHPWGLPNLRAGQQKRATAVN